jgi:hypothetical protein
VNGSDYGFLREKICRQKFSIEKSFGNILKITCIFYNNSLYWQIIFYRSDTMFSNKWVAFGVGVAVGITAAVIIRKPAFRKACAAVIGKGMQLKKDAVAFAESVKEDAQDIIAEAEYNTAKANE